MKFLAVVGAIAFLLSPSLAVALVSRSISEAKDPAAETEALCRANKWVQAGLIPSYSVRTRDAAGNEIRPWLDGGYDRVAVVILSWPTGQSVERKLLSHQGLECVFGE